MRILILGSDYSSRKFFELFNKNKQNIVFSSDKTLENYIDFKDSNDILEFCEANAINLVLIIDEEYINLGLQELISAKNITAFSPTSEAIAISSSKSTAKKFMHKNRIKTPRFQVAETPKMALDYIKTVSFPLAIRPDNHTPKECSLFCETFSGAKKIVSDFFASGNKKIVVEDYIEGKNFSVWTITDGYDARIIGTSAKYQNDCAVFEPDFLNDEIKGKILNEIVLPTISSLCEAGEEYIGILGFDCTIDRYGEIFLLGYNSFFDDINVDFFIEGYDINWAEVFDSAIRGDVFLKYDFKPEQRFMVSLRQDSEIAFFSAKTKSSLKLYLEESGCDLKEFYEAKKIWKS